MKRIVSISADDYCRRLLAAGRHTFTRREADAAIRGSSLAAYWSLYRLVKARRLVMPKSGFYVIVEPRHASLGSPPADWFADDLMAFMKRPYYAGLLTAAQFHGAAHHKSQVFQIITPPKAPRPVRSGGVRIRFYGKGRFEVSETQSLNTPTGILKVSTPETTAWDLVRFFPQAGGFGNAVTVISELAGRLDARRLATVVRCHADRVTARRLGCLLERLGYADLPASWKKRWSNGPLRSLHPGRPVGKARVDKGWNLLLNASVEPEA